MVQDVLMYIIEGLAVLYLIGYLVNSVRQAKREGKCSGCPFASECNIKAKSEKKRRFLVKANFFKKNC